MEQEWGQMHHMTLEGSQHPSRAAMVDKSMLSAMSSPLSFLWGLDAL